MFSVHIKLRQNLFVMSLKQPCFFPPSVMHLKYLVPECYLDEIITCPYASEPFDLLSPYNFPRWVQSPVILI